MGWLVLPYVISYRVLNYEADCLSTVNSLEEYVISLSLLHCTALSCPDMSTLPDLHTTLRQEQTLWRPSKPFYPVLPCPCLHSGASSVSVYINHLSQHYSTQSIHPSIHPAIYPTVLSSPSLSLTPFPLAVSPVPFERIFPYLPSPSILAMLSAVQL